MHRSTKILLGIACIGILLAGIGCGVAVVEFSSMEYTGDYYIPESAAVETTFEVVIDPSKQDAISLGESAGESANIVYSSDIPENMIRWTVIYNQNICNPKLYVSSNRYTGEKWRYVDVDFQYREDVSDFSLFMAFKDQILEDLKQKKISSYDVTAGYTVRIEVSESLAGHMRDGIVYDRR